MNARFLAALFFVAFAAATQCSSATWKFGGTDKSTRVSITSSSTTAISSRYASTWKMWVDMEPCSSDPDSTLVVCSSDTNGGKCTNKANPLVPFPSASRPPWGVSTTCTGNWIGTSNCGDSPDASNTVSSFTLTNSFTCSSMPLISATYPADYAETTAPATSSNFTFQWSYDNYDPAKCLCGSMTFYLGPSTSTLLSNPQITRSVPCANMTDPPVSVVNVNLPLGTTLSKNNASTPWYYWTSVISSSDLAYSLSFTPRAFCIPSLPTTPTLAAPADLAKFTTTSSSLVVTISWNSVTFGYGCSSNNPTYTLYVNSGTLQTFSGLTGTSRDTTINDLGDTVTILWYVRAGGSTYGSSSVQRSFTICMFSQPDYPSGRTPTGNSVHYEDPVVIAWTWSDSNWGSSLCGANISTFTFVISITCTNPSYSNTITLPSSARSYNFAKSMLPSIPSDGATVYWRLTPTGGGGRTNPSSDRTFEFCNLIAPSPPSNLVLSPGASTTCTGSPFSFTATWSATTGWGSHCETRNNQYLITVSQSAGGSTQNSTTSTTYGPSVTCSSQNITVTLVANNGNLSSTQVTKSFILCKRVNPNTPTSLAPNSKVVMPGSTTQKVNWTSIGNWGECCNSSASRGYIVDYWFGAQSHSTVRVDSSTLTTNVPCATVGTWSFYVRAFNGDLYSTPSATRTWTVCQQTPPSQPQLTTPSNGASIINTTIIFRWAAITSWGESCGATMTKQYIWTLQNFSGSVYSTATLPNTTLSTMITLPDQPAHWQWWVIASNGLAGIPTTLSVTREFFQQMVCKQSPPTWPGLWANFPTVSFDSISSSVTFSWNSVTSFGTTCTGVDNAWYTVEINGAKYNKSASVTELTMTLSPGSYAWKVIANNANMSTETAPISFTFCIIAQPPAPTPTCTNGPSLYPMWLSWTTGAWGARCSASTGYTITLIDDNLVVAATLGALYTDTSVSVPTLPDGNYSWSIEAYATPLETSGTATCTNMWICTPAQPAAAILTAASSFTTSSVMLSWTIDAANMASTSCYQGVPQEVNVTILTDTGAFVYSQLMPYTPGTASMFIVRTLAEGNYKWSVNLDNGYQSSGFPSFANFDVCIPGPISEVNLTSPLTGSRPVLATLQLRWQPLPVPKSCHATTSYEVLLGPNASSLAVEQAIAGTDVSYTPLSLANATIYCWAIFIDTTYFTLTSSIECFTTCIPSSPSAPVALIPDPVGIQPTVLGPSVNASWVPSTPGEYCDLGPEVVYTVKLGTSQVLTSSDIVATTADPWAILSGLDDGQTYYWQISATNNGGVTTNGPVNNFTVCFAGAPSVPQLLAPNNGAMIRKSEAPYFDINSPDTLGRLCRNASFLISGFRLYIGLSGDTVRNNPILLPLDVPLVSAHNGIKVVRFENVSLDYGTRFWTAGTTNTDGVETTTDDLRMFVVCDRPFGVHITGPADLSTGMPRNLQFQWEPTTDSVWGYACTQTPGTKQIRVYVDEINLANYSNATAPPTTIISRLPATVTTGTIVTGLKLATAFAWRIGIYNGFEETFSQVWRFTTVDRDCSIVTCLNGGQCNSTTLLCECMDGWQSEDCGTPVPRNPAGAIAGGIIAGVLVIAGATITAAVLLIRRRRKQRRVRIQLKAPGGDLRFSFVKVPSPAPSALDIHAVETRISEEKSCGFATALKFISVTPSTELENVCKALMYSYERHNMGLDLLKAVISSEIAECKNATVIFRSNTAATLMFKHYSKMIGLKYLFDTFASLLEGLLQKEADQAAVERQVAENKKFTQLMTMQDTFEVDPTKVADDMGGEDILSVNSLQLSLTAQRFIAIIFRTVEEMPPELREVCRHIRSEVEPKFPDAVTRALGAFIFLRFFNCAISIPEAYGLIKDAPPESIRRSLVLITKILTTLSAGAHFGDKETFMAQFNELLDNNTAQLTTYYTSLTAFPPIADVPPTEIPEKLYEDSVSVLGGKAKSVLV